MSALLMLAWMAQDVSDQDADAPSVASQEEAGAEPGEAPDTDGTSEAEAEWVDPGPPPGLEMSRLGSGASLYSAGDNRWNRHQVGSLVTVLVEDVATTVVSADTLANQGSSSTSEVGALLGVTTKILGNNPNMLELGDGQFGVSGSGSTDFQGVGSTSRENMLQASLTCTVVEVLPNGNLRLEGHKTIVVNGETQILVVHGIVRPIDVQGDNTIESKYLAEPVIQMSGDGVIDDKQHPGIVNRKLGRIWPF